MQFNHWPIVSHLATLEIINCHATGEKQKKNSTLKILFSTGHFSTNSFQFSKKQWKLHCNTTKKTQQKLSLATTWRHSCAILIHIVFWVFSRFIRFCFVWVYGIFHFFVFVVFAILNWPYFYASCKIHKMQRVIVYDMKLMVAYNELWKIKK